ncbi:MAG: BatA and WFA domain-containing protein [Planctomycetota bacterium]|nr:BatA and WFA domain-containing protein [Planctomycetota bacterium]
MTLLAPWALWLSAAGAAVVALYLLKIKRRREPVPALDFWRELIVQTQVRSLFQRLKRWLSLLLWLVIVTCLILAVGNPVFSFGRIKPQSIVVIVDNSASMQSVENRTEGTTRLQLVRRALDELLERRPVSDEWMLIEAGGQSRVLTAWTRNREAVRRAAESISPHFGSVDLAEAGKLAGQLLSGKPRPCIVIISDGSDGEVPKIAREDKTVVYWPIGETDDNLGITQLSVRPHREQSVHYAFISVINGSSAAVESQVVFQLDGSTTAVEPISISSGETWEKTVVLDAPDGAVLRAWIDRPDAFPADNESYAVLDPIERVSVLLVSPADASFFFEQSLLAMESFVDADASRTMTMEDYDALGDTERQADLIIFNNGPPRDLPATGQFVFINGWPDPVPAKSLGTLQTPDLRVTQRDHPLTRHLNFSTVTLARAIHVDLASGQVVLAESSDGSPLIFLWQQPDRQALCLAFDVLESNLPFRNAFPVFLRNAVAYMMSEQRAWIRPLYRVGEVIEPVRPLPSGVREVAVARLRHDDVWNGTVPVRDGSFLFQQTQHPGPFRFTIGDETAYTAVNLHDRRESRIAPDKAAEPPEKRLALSGRLFGTVPWLAFSMLAAALIGLEWLTYHHRWTE